MTKATIGFAMCGSFCTFSKAFTQMQRLVDSGYDVIPIMSQNAFSTSTRFGKAEETYALLHLWCFPNAIEVMLSLRTINGNTYAKMVYIFLNKVLHLRGMVVDSIR